MTGNIVDAMNQISRNHKTTFMNYWCGCHPSIALSSDLSKKTWDEILQTTYELTDRYQHTLDVTLLGIDSYIKFTQTLQIKQFFITEFSPVLKFAFRCKPAKWSLEISPNQQKQIVVIPPSDTNIKDCSIELQQFTPCVSKMFFVSKNKFAHKIDPALICDVKRGCFLVKAVPELPHPTMVCPLINNINIR